MIQSLVLFMITAATPAVARVTTVEPWVEIARAKLATVFADFMTDELRAIDEGVLIEIQRLEALIKRPRARENFRNLLTKIYVIPSPDHLARYVARLGAAPWVTYPYHHAIELTPTLVRGPAGRSFLIQQIQRGFDRVTGFGRVHVPGVSPTGVGGVRARRAEIAFLRRHVPAEQRARWMDDLVRRGDPGVRDVNIKFYRRLAAAGGADAAPVLNEAFDPSIFPRVACELDLWRYYHPKRDRDRLLTHRPGG